MFRKPVCQLICEANKCNVAYKIQLLIVRKTFGYDRKLFRICLLTSLKLLCVRITPVYIHMFTFAL